MRALSQSKPSELQCRRCKRQFTQKKQEARCGRCRETRRANRTVQRKAARVREAHLARAHLTMKSVDRMMRNNSNNRAGSVRLIG